MDKTIFALSSGGLPSGIAVIRLSGSGAFSVLNLFTDKSPSPRNAVFTGFYHPTSRQLLDKGLILTFEGSNSFTGEDVVEFHCHGGVASVAGMLDALAQQKDCRPAEAGEFSRRAFENGKMDLTGVEGLSDLIAAQTEAQRRQALSQSGGNLRELYDGWRDELIRARALIEAELDFSDEEDVPGSVSRQVWGEILDLKFRIKQHLDDGHRGEMVRDGFRIALLGPPNSGKSSLLNALAKREVAIVTPQAGTTRDVLEISLNIGGHLIIVSDTAGLRDSFDIAEQEGIKRAKLAAEQANMVLWLQPLGEPIIAPEIDGSIVIGTKNDLGGTENFNPLLTISTRSVDGLVPLLEYIETHIQHHLLTGEDAVVSRQRHRLALELTSESLGLALDKRLALELRSENLRKATDALGQITGRIDVEDLLDVIFSEFCIGK